jgi:hypothetical protein
LTTIIRGGPGSGHFEHEGRPGEVGGSKPSGDSDDFQRDKRRLIEYARDNWDQVDRATALTWMAPNGEMFDIIGTGFRHDENAALALVDAGIWEQGAADAVHDAGRIFAGQEAQDQLIQHDFVRISRAGKELSFQFVSPRRLTRNQKAILGVEALLAHNKGWTVVGEPKELGLPDWYEYDDLLDILGVSRTLKPTFRGGPGSGHHGHKGRPGERGGSLPSGRADVKISGRMPKIIKAGVRDVLDEFPASLTADVEIQWVSDHPRGSHHPPHSNRIVLSREDAPPGIVFTSSDMNGDRVVNAKDAMEYPGAKVVENLDAHLARQIIAHEMGHVIRDRLSSEMRERISKAMTRFGPKWLDTPAIRSYAGYFESGESLAAEQFPGFADRKLNSERFAEAIRIWYTEPEQHVKWPISLKRVIDSVETSAEVTRGGPGSGHFGHQGRKGEVGGSLPSGNKKFTGKRERDFQALRKALPRLTLQDKKRIVNEINLLRGRIELIRQGQGRGRKEPGDSPVSLLLLDMARLDFTDTALYDASRDIDFYENAFISYNMMLLWAEREGFSDNDPTEIETQDKFGSLQDILHRLNPYADEYEDLAEHEIERWVYGVRSKGLEDRIAEAASLYRADMIELFSDEGRTVYERYEIARLMTRAVSNSISHADAEFGDNLVADVSGTGFGVDPVELKGSLNRAQLSTQSREAIWRKWLELANTEGTGEWGMAQVYQERRGLSPEALAAIGFMATDEDQWVPPDYDLPLQAQLLNDGWQRSTHTREGILLTEVAADMWGGESIDRGRHTSDSPADLLVAQEELAFFLDNEDRQGRARDFLQTMYDDTQAQFRSWGLEGDETIRLYRGMKDNGLDSWNEDGWVGDAEVDMWSLSSWSSDLTTAVGFAGMRGMVVVADIPISRIVSGWHQGWTAKKEEEFIVLGLDGIDSDVYHTNDGRGVIMGRREPTIDVNGNFVSKAAKDFHFHIDEEASDWIREVAVVERGGPGSGHHGHKGREGEVGGSLPDTDVAEPDEVVIMEPPTIADMEAHFAGWVTDDLTEVRGKNFFIAPSGKLITNFGSHPQAALSALGSQGFQTAEAHVQALQTLISEYHFIRGFSADSGRVLGVETGDPSQITRSQFRKLNNLLIALAPERTFYDASGFRGFLSGDDIDELFKLGRVARSEEPSMLQQIFNMVSELVERGGKGSGHHGHKGRKGKVGGSLPSGRAPAEEPRGKRGDLMFPAPEPDLLEKLKSGEWWVEMESQFWPDRRMIAKDEALQWLIDNQLMGEEEATEFVTDLKPAAGEKDFELSNQAVTLSDFLAEIAIKNTTPRVGDIKPIDRVPEGEETFYGVEPGSRPPAVRASLQEIEQRIATNDFESAFHVDPETGEITLEKVGGDHEVEFTDEEAAGARGKITVHNHPSGQPPSMEDFALVLNTKSSEGHVYHADGRYIFRFNPDLNAIEREELRQTYMRAYRDVKHGVDHVFKQGRLTSDEAWEALAGRTIEVVEEQHPDWFDYVIEEF